MQACVLGEVFQDGGKVTLRLLAFAFALTFAVFTYETNAKQAKRKSMEIFPVIFLASALAHAFAFALALR